MNATTMVPPENKPYNISPFHKIYDGSPAKRIRKP
jgi:hypothetical protein